jgi:hypothetical protein
MSCVPMVGEPEASSTDVRGTLNGPDVYCG